MLDFGAIDEDEYEAAVSEPLLLSDRISDEEAVNSWFVETVNEDVIRDLVNTCGFSERAARLLVYGGGLKIYTT